MHDLVAILPLQTTVSCNLWVWSPHPAALEELL